MIEVSFLVTTAAALAAVIGYAYYKDNYSSKGNEVSNDKRHSLEKVSDEERQKSESLHYLYSASLFRHHTLKDMYIQDVLRNGYPYKEPWYSTMVGVLGLLDDLQERMIRFPSPNSYVFGDDAVTIRTLNVHDITLLTCRRIDYKFNPHLKLASWLFYVGMLEEFREIPYNALQAKRGDSIPLSQILTVAHYCLVDLEPCDREAIVKMIQDFWENTSDFITSNEMLEMAEKHNLFRAEAQFNDIVRDVITYPIGHQFKRFKKRRATMEEHKKW